MALKAFAGTTDITGSVAGADMVLLDDVSAGTPARCRADHLSSKRRITSLAQGNDTITVSQAGIVLVANSGTMTLTLPAAANCTGHEYTFKKTTAAAFAITLDGNASETIDGATTFTAMDAQYDTVTIVSDGSNWHVTAKIIA